MNLMKTDYVLSSALVALLQTASGKVFEPCDLPLLVYPHAEAAPSTWASRAVRL